MKSASLLLTGLAAALAVFYPAVALVYWADDLDHLQAIAIWRSGQVSFLWWLLQTHNEHIVPVLRLFFLNVTGRWGFNAQPAYASAILLYGVCAALAGVLTLRRTGSWLRGCGAALFFAAAGTIAPMAVTMLTATMFTQALMFYLLALIAEHPWARIGCCAAACICFPGSFPFAAAVALDAWPHYRWRAAAAYAALLAAVIAFNSAAHWFVGATPKTPDVTGAPIGLWMPFSAPFRLVWSWTGTPLPSIAIISAVSALLWAVICFFGRKIEPAGMRRLILAVLAGAVFSSLLTGMGRGHEFSLTILFWTDRYYAFFLLPAALFMASVPRRHWMLLPVALAAVVVARVEVNRMRRDVFPHKSSAQFDAANRLASIVAEEVRLRPAEPLLLAEEFLPFAGMHKGGMHLSTVFYISYPNGLPGVKFVRQLTPVQRLRMDDMLTRWRIATGLTAQAPKA